MSARLVSKGARRQKANLQRLDVDESRPDSESDLYEAIELLEEALGELEATWGPEAHTSDWTTRAASLLSKYEDSN